ncbi:hypothetical protein EDE11_10989 [Methylomonas methanica]|uniref:Uncharacterized protein n=1 Tax=Methylomonas methanica TaxID=421 RepID=A0ABY2CLM2_METMH|nr:hypothetical protein EDE11_10989 [Methylomonas methanica]
MPAILYGSIADMARSYRIRLLNGIGCILRPSLMSPENLTPGNLKTALSPY